MEGCYTPRDTLHQRKQFVIPPDEAYCVCWPPLYLTGYTFNMTHQELRDSVKAAMLAKDSVRLLVVRGLVTAATNDLVAKGKKPTDTLTPEEVQAIVSRAVKQRKDSIEQFTAGNRADLADTEKAELAILEAMLPPQMSEEEIEAAVRAKVAEMGPVDKAKAGQFIGAVMRDLKGKADGSAVKAVVERVLA